jgi:glycosyltransferase involved in cell wall biosynthesis
MKIVMFSHPAFSVSQSMPRFAKMIEAGMKARGHEVEMWTADPRFYRIPLKRLKKWLGYLDQFVVFPVEAWLRMLRLPKDTLFVFTDQALGPWIKLVGRRPHVIHCHDLLALRSSLGEFPDTSTSWTGRLYQSYIQSGFTKGRNFISVSGNTRQELHRFLEEKPILSEVVYNGLNYPYSRLHVDEAGRELQALSVPWPEEGFILHVGGNQWYKNRAAVLAIYEELAARLDRPPALWMAGLPPPESLRERARNLKAGRVHFISGMTNLQLQACYSLARALIFPSLEEGFGWPIVEAMSCGCPVLTTGAAPMTEIAGDAAVFVPRVRVSDRSSVEHAADALERLLSEDVPEAEERRSRGMQQAAKFSTDAAISKYERVYREVLDGHGADGSVAET